MRGASLGPPPHFFVFSISFQKFWIFSLIFPLFSLYFPIFSEKKNAENGTQARRKGRFFHQKEMICCPLFIINVLYLDYFLYLPIVVVEVVVVVV